MTGLSAHNPAATTLKRVAIMGSGGIGGYLGARLAQSGVEVTFIARGEHLYAMQENGLRIDDQGEEFVIKPVSAVDDTLGVEPADVILFAVKLRDTECALQLCRPLMHDDTFIITFQNGVESVDLINGVIGEGRTIGGAAYIVSNIVEPGVIRKTAPVQRLEFAEPDGARSPRALALAELLRSCGADVELMDDLSELLWRKFIFLSASSAMTALTRQPMGYVQNDPVAQGVMAAAVAETVAVARALGIKVGSDIEEKTLHGLRHLMQGDTKASQLVDLERGKPLELEWLSGAIHRFGKQTGVPTPVHSTAYAALRPFSNGQIL